MKSTHSNANTIIMVVMLSNELEAGIGSLSRSVPNVMQLIAHLINVANEE